MNHMNSADACKCPHHKLTDIVIILFGLALLSQLTGILSPVVVAFAIPVLIIAFGVIRLLSGHCRCYARS